MCKQDGMLWLSKTKGKESIVSETEKTYTPHDYMCAVVNHVSKKKSSNNGRIINCSEQ